jgi:hypothetical protein
MDLQLSGKRVWWPGELTATTLAAEGAAVVVHGRNEES